MQNLIAQITALVAALQGQFDNLVDRLARQALLHAADQYESGAFEWANGYEFIDGDAFNTARRPDRGVMSDGQFFDNHAPAQKDGVAIMLPSADIYKLATGGCALGGVARSAFFVTGKPEYASDDWMLKLAVERRADFLLARAIRGGHVDDGCEEPTIYGFNDDHPATTYNEENYEYERVRRAPKTLIEALRRAAEFTPES